MHRRQFLIGAASVATLASCTAEYPRATTEAVQRAFYRAPGPSHITLYSMLRDSDHKSEHSGLLISGSQRVLYDPAGSYNPASEVGWYAPPRKDDIHYGMNDLAVRQYERFHARLGFYILRQRVEVPMEIADLAIRKSQEKGETIMTQCASSVSWVMRQLPGFSGISQTMLPNTLVKDFALLPNVQTSEFHENDVGQNYANLTVGNPDDLAPPFKPIYGRGEG